MTHQQSNVQGFPPVYVHGSGDDDVHTGSSNSQLEPSFTIP